MWVSGPEQEMSENLEVFREVWSMRLSATRNRIIRINLVVTVATFALTACIVPASFFGMNLPTGLGAPPSPSCKSAIYSAYPCQIVGVVVHLLRILSILILHAL